MTPPQAPARSEQTRTRHNDAVGRLELDTLTKTFDGTSAAAVDGVSLDVQPGEFITLLGPSGCGKTTTLRIVAGFETATSGRLRLDGRSIDGLLPQRRQM